MKHWKTAVATVTAWAFLYGCATRPENVTANYVSPLQYQSYDCDQVQGELLRVNRHVSEVTGQQQATADRDAVALGVGLVLFWPALFFMVGGDKSEQLGRLKGEYDALEQVAVLKKCDVSTQLAQARQDREAYAAQLRERQNPTGSKAAFDTR
jgi:hypothetical protein